MADDDKIRVQRPDGRYSMIPRTSLQGAMARGYKLAPSNEFLAGEKERQQAASAAAQPLLKHFWEDDPSSFHNIEGESFKRSLGSLGDTLKGVLPGTYHAFLDPATKEETKEAPDLYGPHLRGFTRTVAKPVATAIDWYKDVARGKVPNAYEQALSVGPEAMGTAGGAEIAGKLTTSLPRIAKASTKGASTAFRVASQEVAGAGREPVLRAAINHQEAVESAQAKYKKAVEDYRAADASAKATHAEKVRSARQEWVEKTAAARRAKSESAAATSQRETLQRGQEAYATRLRDNIQSAYRTTLSRLDARWHHLRETPVEGDKLRALPLNSTKIVDAIDHARQTKLMGSPDSLKQFNDLMGWMDNKFPNPITWDEARVHYSALGDRMFSGDLPGNVLQAVREVRNALDSQLNQGAMRAGVQDIYSALKRDWSSFESDWKDMSSVTTRGGSPLARARMAPNADTLIPQVTGRTGDLLLQRLAKYKSAGASTSLAEGVRRITKQSQSVPTVRVPKEPGRLELPAEPKPGPAPELKSPDKLDPVAIRRAKLLERAGRGMTWWDLIPFVGAEHLMLKNPRFLEWVAKQPRNEIPPPARTP